MYSFSLEADELILRKSHASYTCQGDVLSGALYLTDRRLVFVGYILSIDNKYLDEIPLTHIKDLMPEKTFFIIPNVLKVITIKDKTIKFVIENPHDWLEAINKQIASVN